MRIDCLHYACTVYLHFEIPLKILMYLVNNCSFYCLDEVLGCVLSLYMGSEHDQPLPTDEEVIICDENTTAEEVCQPNEKQYV